MSSSRRSDSNHVPVAYLLFEGEGHGFRRAENQRRSLEAELSFYGQVFGFTPADDLPPLPIEGLREAVDGPVSTDRMTDQPHADSEI